MAGEIAQQVLQEADDVRTVEWTLLDQQEQAVIQGDATDGRQVVAGQRHVQDGRLRARSVGANHRRQQVEAGFVYPDDGLTPAVRPLFKVGQRSAYQAAMAPRCAGSPAPVVSADSSRSPATGG
jgi:hypothetical protein